MSNENDIKKELEKELSRYDASKEGSLKWVLHTSFTRQLRGVLIFAWIYIGVFTAIAIYAGWAFMNASAIEDKVLWATIFLAAFLVICVAKLWYWMIANRNALAREIKRLELQVSLLMEKLEKKGDGESE